MNLFSLHRKNIASGLRMGLYSPPTGSQLNRTLGSASKARFFSLHLAAFFAMLLLFATACLMGCTGATSTSKSTTPAIASSLHITTNALPVATVHGSYNSILAATGGLPPYSWHIASGSLPAGLTLNLPTGNISGAPTLAGSYSFVVGVQDTAASSVSSGFSLNVSPLPAPAVSAVSPNSGPTTGGAFITISGNNFRSGAAVQFGNLPALSVNVVDSTQIQAVTPAAASGSVNVTVQNSDGQAAALPSAFTFTAPAPSSAAVPNADVVVDASQTVSESGGNDILAARNIYSSASSPESNGGMYRDSTLISSEFQMKRMRAINGLGDCALNGTGKLTGCGRLNTDLQSMAYKGLTPHVVVGQWAPASIGGNPLQWGAAQWAQYDALCYAIVNYIANQYGGTGFPEALFEVENEMDTTSDPRDLWLTTSTTVTQGDPSRFAQFDKVYAHWANAVNLVAQQNPTKKIRIAGPATGFWSVYYGSGQLWHNQIIQKYAAQNIRLDVVSLHIYSREVNDLVKYAQSIRNTLIASGNPKAEIWVSEWGASDTGDSVLGAINATHQGAAWAINFLLQALKGSVTGGSFLLVRDNEGADTEGAQSNMYEATWTHVQKGVEYPKAIMNAFSMVDRMAGARNAAAVNTAKPDLHALASSDINSASLIVANYNYHFDFPNKNYSDLTTNESVAVTFKNLSFSGPVIVDRYLIDAQTSNLFFWFAKGQTPPSLQATQLQKVESFSATATGGTLVLPARQLGPSAVSLWIAHQ
jgi:IPT/TIG domain/Putative Ig domain/Glycosyl hydrolase catalytic core